MRVLPRPLEIEAYLMDIADGIPSGGPSKRTSVGLGL